MKFHILRNRRRNNAPYRAHISIERLETRALLATVLRSAHVHLQLNFSDGNWGAFEVEDTTHGVTYAPKDVLIFVDPAQKTTQPAGWNFIGAGDDNPYWRMDSSSSSPFVSLSVATEHIPNGTFDVYQPTDPRVTFAGEWIRLELKQVQGPGFVSSWQNGQPPNAWWMSSSDDGQTLDSAFYTEPGGHTHLNWGFTEKGIYKVTYQASAYFGGAELPVLSEELVLKFGVETTRRPPNPFPPAPGVRSVLWIGPTVDPLTLPVELETSQSRSVEIIESTTHFSDVAEAPLRGGANATNGDAFDRTEMLTDDGFVTIQSTIYEI